MDIETILSSVVFSTLISAMISLITIKIQYKNDVKKWILERRAETYFRYYDDVEKILIDKNTIFDIGYRDSLTDMKPQMKLIASEETFKAFKEYYEFVCDTVRDYEKYRDANDPAQDLSRLEEIIDDNGERREQMHITEQDMEIFEFKMKQYKKDTIQEIGPEIVPKVEALYQKMREDLGSHLNNLKRRK